MNKTFKKVLSVVLALAMVVTSITIYNTTAKAAEIFAGISAKAEDDGTLTVSWTAYPEGWSLVEAYLLTGEQTEDADVTADDAAHNSTNNWVWNTQGKQYGGCDGSRANNIDGNAAGTVKVEPEKTYTVILVAYAGENKGDTTTELGRQAITFTMPKAADIVTGQEITFSDFKWRADGKSFDLSWSEVKNAKYRSYLLEGDVDADTYVRSEDDYVCQPGPGWCWTTGSPAQKYVDGAGASKKNLTSVSTSGTYTFIVDAISTVDNTTVVGTGVYTIKPSAPEVKHTVTIDGVPVADAVEGVSYKLPANTLGYTDGKTNYKNEIPNVTEDIELTTIDIKLEVVGASIRQNPLGIRFKTVVTGGENVPNVTYGTRIGSWAKGADGNQFDNVRVDAENRAEDGSYIVAIVDVDKTYVGGQFFAFAYANITYADAATVVDAVKSEQIDRTIQGVADKAGIIIE